MTRQEFIDLLEREGTGVYSFCRMLTGNKEEGEELYQETMLRATERYSLIDSSQNPKSYLISLCIGIYKNNRKKFARRQRIAPVGELTEELSCLIADKGETPEEAYLRREIEEVIRLETKKLPEHLRIPLYLYYTAQLSVEEIGKMMHIPKGTVKSRLHRARMLMKKKLEDYGYEEGKGNGSHNAKSACF
ncbi:MAG: RNA polymerase sigma factor [Lachnospiraceae bacterium]|nr:RNA polymerase sigma factor [Lachnospiraceae bacterium]MDE6980087.1 RNA polymerase sigma factor [Lachnospiraceae bacterium]